MVVVSSGAGPTQTLGKPITLTMAGQTNTKTVNLGKTGVTGTPLLNTSSGQILALPSGTGNLQLSQQVKQITLFLILPLKHSPLRTFLTVSSWIVSPIN